MEPQTSEASTQRLELAREQGEAYGRALRHMTDDVAHDGAERQAGHYLIGYAIEEAEGCTSGRMAKSCGATPAR